jgi:hypothetical protein
MPICLNFGIHLNPRQPLHVSAPFVAGVLDPRTEFLIYIDQVGPLAPICPIKRQVMIDVRERKFN